MGSDSRYDSRFTRRAVRFLLDRGLISGADVHRYGVVARDVSESNSVVLVEMGNGRGFAVKDLAAPRDGGQGEPTREVALYQAASGLPEAAGLLPCLMADAGEEHLLVLEGLVSARRLDRLTGPQDPLDPRLAATFGRVLGAWHRLGAGLTGLSPARPWLLDLPGPDRLPVLDHDERLRTVATAILDDTAHAGAIESVAAAWTPDTVIHGDVRFSNVLVRRSGEAAIVDWESAGIGDSAWDVASGVQEYVSAGGVFRPDRGGSENVDAFLDGYAGGRGRPVDRRRLAPFVACRLLVRALQLVTWLPDPKSEVDRHRALAREVLAPAGRVEVMS